jgi:transposase-like protein
MSSDYMEARPSSRAELAAWYESLLEEQEQSGLSVAEFAEEIGVTASTLYQWRRRLSSPDRGAGGMAAGLVRVQVAREEAGPAARSSLVVRLRGGRVLEVPPGYDADELSRLIEVLEAC